MNLTRCFIALELPPPIQKHLGVIISRLKEAQADVKWVDPQNTHLTLKFLGEISPDQLKLAREALVKQNGKFGSIVCRTGQIGVFPGWSRPQVVWLGLKDGVPKISDLQGSLEQGLAECGFAKEPKKFKPHLTLGRARSPNNTDKLAEIIHALSLEDIEFRFEALSLIKSTLTPGGPVYQPLETINLT